ncbi:MAG TPA: ABC transporter ATP-binding protein [Clostridiales bacterium]|nr:ABC transporter ATP-binding protein [Clostridiales bacterium]
MFLIKNKYGLPDMIILPFKVSPFYSAVFAVQRIVSGLMPTFTIFVTAKFVNTAIAILNKTAELRDIYVPIALLAGIMLYGVVIGVLMEFVNCRANIVFRKKLRPEMAEKRARLEYRHIEDQNTADLINRVCPVIDTTVKDMYMRVLDIAENLIYAAGILVALFTQVWWVALFLAVSGVPILTIATKAGERSYEADREMSKIDRRTWYLSDVLKSREAVEERSVYGYSGKLNEQFAERYEFARKFRMKVSIKNFIKQKMGGIITSILSTAVMLAMLPPVVQGKIDIGMFIGMMGGVFSLSGKLSWGVNWIIEDLARKKEYLKDLTEFMKLEEHDDANALPDRTVNFRTIEFRNVSFRYPGTEKLILDNISFVIESGKHYAFVGVNGAGKTTVTKLITGLYSNYEGEILVDGRPLRSMSQAEIKGLSSVVYQDFAKYYISMYDNIALGCLNQEHDRADIENAAELAGLSDTIERLPDGMDTPLGKIQEKGVDISGGEWQRVAIARGIASSAPLRILDEPTASLDPVSESMVYKKFEQISRGMTTIFISHRLGSTKLADIIYVIADGRIAESGSHEELMEKNGIYAEMFRAQAEWYKTGESDGPLHVTGRPQMNETGVAANA